MSPIEMEAQIEELRRQNTELRQALEDRKLIERAKGVLMEWDGCPEREAHRRLQKASMNSRQPVVEIARLLLESEEVSEPEARQAVQQQLHLTRSTTRPAAAPRPRRAAKAAATSCN